jgi:hypothetical protein
LRVLITTEDTASPHITATFQSDGRTPFFSRRVHAFLVEIFLIIGYVEGAKLLNKFVLQILLHYICFSRSRDSVVGIATSYGWKTKSSEFEFRYGQEFSLLHVVQTGCGFHPTSYPVGTGGEAAGA